MRSALYPVVVALWLLQAAPALAQGNPQSVPQPIKVNDNTRGISLAIPGNGWYIQSNSYNLEAYPLNDSGVSVRISEAYSSKLTVDDIYADEKEFMKESLPGAVFIRENEKFMFPGNIAAVAMTFKNPSVLEIKRTIFFIHRGQRYQMVFLSPEAKLPSYKEDFSLVLRSLSFYEPSQSGMEVIHPKLGARASTPSNDKGWYVQADHRAFDLIFQNQTSYKKEVVITMEFDESVSAASLQTAYDQRAADIKRNLPGAQYVSENQKAMLGATEALSLTYKNTSKLTVHRVMVYLRQGATQEFRFSLFDSVFEKYKPDLSAIMKSVRIE